jgi:2-keto-3-deoxy-L-rhamnonate aldolase RhmA
MDLPVNRFKRALAAGILSPVEENARRDIEQGCLFVSMGNGLGLFAAGTTALAGGIGRPAG